jgi:Flp pilus assembly protein CpaB
VRLRATQRPARATVAWAAAALLALGTARVVATDLAALHRRATDGEPRTVVVARRDLALGAVVRADDVGLARLDAPRAPRRPLERAADAVGRTVTVPVLAGGVVVEGAVAPRGRDGLDGLVPPGRRAVRVVTDDGLRPAPGDVVDVLASFDPSLVVDVGGGEPTVTVAAAAVVLAVDATDHGDGGVEAGDPLQRVGVTLLVTEAEAHRLAFASANGTLVLAVAPPEDACCSRSSSGSSRG